MTRYINHLDNQKYEATTIQELIGLMSVMSGAASVEDWMADMVLRAAAGGGPALKAASPDELVVEMIELGYLEPKPKGEMK